MLSLAGIPEAADKADRVMALETRLAASHWDKVSNRDAIKTYNAFTFAEAGALAPQLPWESWVCALGAPAGSFDKIVVRRTLSGQPQNKERWKRGVSAVEGGVGEAVGQLYAERWFPASAKERMNELVANLVEAFRRSFASLEWMSEATR